MRWIPDLPMLNRKFLSAAGVALVFGLLLPAQSNGAILDLGDLVGTERRPSISGDGTVITGSGRFGFPGLRAFVIRFDKSTSTIGSPLNPGTLGAALHSEGFGVSADGSVIVGASDFTHAIAFTYDKITNTAGPIVDIGSFGGNSMANAVSADGSVIVGESYNGSNNRAFAVQFNQATNTAGTMVDLGSFGDNSNYSQASGVSADGSIIVGRSIIGSAWHAILWVDVFTVDPYMVDVTEWMRSISGPAGILPIVSSLSSLPMEGAHHRPLMSLDAMGKSRQCWVTGDFGTRSRASDSNTSSGEAGVSGTFGQVVAGVAFGYGEQNNDLLYGGASHVSGQYLLGEADYRLGDKQSILSLTTMIGNWKSDTLRGYGVENGAIDYSHGATDLRSASVRLRLDGPAQQFIGGMAVTPFASFTWSHISADAYSETGGSFDAQFDKQSHDSREGRMGLTTKLQLDPDTSLLLTGEWIHRFDKNHSGFSGTDVDHGALPFSVAGARIAADQARFGLDIDHKISADTLLNVSIHFTGVGEAPDFSGAMSIRRAF